ncbi:MULTISPECIES: CGNR zinc finger domain-containing protein [unclassified Microbacterium]|uniref:CGNR zinc finger domain-containing protein n=1 Tax=unclassified Microbacterium TaxID=2609290 RepID=UPI003018617C
MTPARASVDEAQEPSAESLERLASRYTATLSRRLGADPFDRLTTPERLRLWPAANGLDPEQEPTTADLAEAIALRETVYRLGAAIAGDLVRDPPDSRLLNAAAAAGHPVPEQTGTGMRWRLDGPRPVRAALAVIARDVIALLGGDDAGRVKTCDGVDCAGLYLDTSRGDNRRWCSMNTCGNKNKKSRMRAHP